MINTPIISCITLTYGRNSNLAEAVACFLAQSYQNKELIIFNTLVSQQIVCEHPQIQVINCTERPRNLGETRNAAIAASTGEWIVTADDDDLALSHHLENFSKHFNSEAQWLWQPSQYFVSQGRIKSITKGSMNVVAFTRKAFDGIGGYAPMNTGEDRQFVSRLTEKYPGIKIPMDNFNPSYLYAWGQGNVYHVSGEGEDRQGRANAWDRAEKDMQRKIRNGLVKRGSIIISPSLNRDYEKMASEFSKQTANVDKKKPEVAIVMPGRFGDLCNLLPVMQLVHDNYDTPHVIVAQEFASLLEGVSYVHAHPVPIKNDRLREFLKYAEARFPIVINGGIWGAGWSQERHTASFNKESWRNAGFAHRFADSDLRPVFDRRNLAREEALWSKLRQTEKPVLLVQVKNSVSSPFPHGKRVVDAIYARWQTLCEIIDLSEVRAERIFDVLGLFDRAAALVCVDTALIHLAAGSNIPLVALVNPQPWLGSLPRANCVRRLTYTEAANEPELVNGGIATALGFALPKLQPRIPSKPPERRVLHAVERHEQGSDARREAAQGSWDALYANGVIPCHLWEYPRNATQIGDKRELPYLKDILKNALNQASSDDIVFWTNDDNWIHPAVVDRLKFHVGTYGAVTSQRCEFRGRNIPPASQPPSTFAKLGRHHMGRDLFAATASWFETNWDALPDMILGQSDFDLFLACYVRLEKGVITSRKNIEESIFPCELERGYVSHQYHVPKWTQDHSSPAQAHNRLLFYQWAKQHLPSLQFHAGLVI